MKFILHSQIGEDSIRYNLGRSDYSYYFILKAYQSALMEIGSVVVVQNPETEVDPIYDNCVKRGEDCVFLSFALPHKTPMTLRCPTVPVIAWGFGNIPEEVWDDDPFNDWRFVLTKLGRAITLSSCAARAITASMGGDFPVRAIAPPVAARVTENWRYTPSNLALSSTRFAADRVVIDSSTVDLSPEFLAPSERPEELRIEPQLKSKLRIPMSRYRTGRQSALLRQVAKAVSPVIIDGAEADATPAPEINVSAGGVVYTSVLNPMVSHKNWGDLVTAFCWAFRDTDDATLILKMAQQNIAAYWGPFVHQLARLSPFKCRIVALHGYFEDAEYDKLISATSYYVNTSCCEGLCRPLTEFLACGRSAIAPMHTAMADYIDRDIAFVLRASPELGVWPHDTRGYFRTMKYRLDWMSLCDAFRKSYHLAKESPELYSEMATRARHKMQKLYSIPIITEQLRDYFTQPDKFDVGAPAGVAAEPALARAEVIDPELR